MTMTTLETHHSYAELAVTTNFSFLRGASHPQELVATANELGLAAIGIAAAYALCIGFLGIDSAYTWHNMVKYTDVENVEMGIIKAFVYGGIIGALVAPGRS